MKHLAAFTNSITRAIIEATESLGKSLPQYGENSGVDVFTAVQDTLDNDVIMRLYLDTEYYEATGRFGCPMEVEDALIVAGSFNAEPMVEFVRGECTLTLAIEHCFQQTFWDTMRNEYLTEEVPVAPSPDQRPPRFNEDYPGMEVPDIMCKSQSEVIDAVENGKLSPVKPKDEKIN